MKVHEVVVTLTGFLFIAIGAFFLHQEMNGPVAHIQHVYVFAALMVLGGGFIFPTLIQGLVKSLADRLPSLRWGSRGDDAPIEKAPPGTAPGDPVQKKDEEVGG